MIISLANSVKDYSFQKWYDKMIIFVALCMTNFLLEFTIWTTILFTLKMLLILILILGKILHSSFFFHVFILKILRTLGFFKYYSFTCFAIKYNVLRVLVTIGFSVVDISIYFLLTKVFLLVQIVLVKNDSLKLSGIMLVV